MPDTLEAAEPTRPANPNAARDHLANERTLLAWVRTGIAIVALGFVVARFGLVLSELGKSAPRHTDPALSTALGVALIACSAVLIVLATVRYDSTARGIDRNEYRPAPGLIFVLASMFIAVAAILCVYLVVTT